MAKETTASLNVSERIQALAILNGYKGNLDVLAVILEDIKQLPITDEEWEQAERKITPGKNENGEDVATWNWNDDKGPVKEVKLQKETVDYLNKIITDKNDKGEYTLQDKAIISLKSKI